MNFKNIYDVIDILKVISFIIIFTCSICLAGIVLIPAIFLFVFYFLLFLLINKIKDLE